MKEDKGVLFIGRPFRSRKIWGILLLILLIALTFVLVNRDKTTVPAPITAECNPIPVTPPPLPDFVESITYQGPKIHGPVQSIHTDGDMVFMAIGDKFAILDVSNPAEPQIIGSLPLKKKTYLSEISHFSIQDNLAYFRWENKNFTVDISNPAKPVHVECTSVVPWPDATQYFRSRYEINPTSVGQIFIEEQVFEGATLPLVDSLITVFTSPRIEWNQSPGQIIPLPNYIEPELMPLAGRGYTFDDRYLYLVNGIEVGGAYCCGRLTIFDLNNPAKPKEVGTAEINDDFFISYSVKKYEEFLLISIFSDNDGYTIIYDVKDKSEPIELTYIPGLNMPYMHNGYVYFVHPRVNPTDIEIWSLFEEDSPKFLKQITIPKNPEPLIFSTLDSQLIFHDDYIQLANGETLEILDNHTPNDVSSVNRIQFPAISVPVHLAISDNYVAALTRPSGLHPHATIGEFVEANEQWQEPKWNVFIDKPSLGYADIAINGDNIFLLETNSPDILKLYVFDTTRPIGSNIVSLFEMKHENSYSYRMAINFPYLYIIENETGDGLVIIDVSDPTDPRYISEIVLDTAAFFDLTVWEDNLFLVSTTGTDDIWQFDISDPLAPQFVARYPASHPDAITAGNGFLFVLNAEMQIEITDLRFPENPSYVGTFDIESEAALDIFYHDGTLWIALGHRGLAAVQLNLDLVQ